MYRLIGLDSPDQVHVLDSRLLDVLEGVRSFLECRQPEFTGEVPDDFPGYLRWR